MTRRLQASLLRWYRRVRRPLPWRRDASPYRVWVAETMLQQTTIAAVRPRYDRFLRRFPDLKTLAAAREASVLREWAGLGYYARARNLRRAAQAVLREHGGRIPSDEPALRALPGVGAYTAAALRSIAFSEPAAVLDGNVVRVLCRLLGVSRDARLAATRRLLQEEADKLLDRRHPGDWNQAVMELGETVCVPENPRCGECPARSWCAARRLGRQEQLPVLGPRPRPFRLLLTCLWVERGGRVLLWKRSAQERLLKGHWGLPEAGHLRARPGALLKTVRHAITRHAITLEVRRAWFRGRLPRQARWVDRARLRGLLVSSLWLKALPRARAGKS